MKRSRRDRPDDPVLFDLPLQETSSEDGPGPSRPDAGQPDERNLSLFGDAEASEGAVDGSEDGARGERGGAVAPNDGPAERQPTEDSWVGEADPEPVDADLDVPDSVAHVCAAPVSARLVAGLADLVVHGGVLAVAVIGLVVMGIRPRLSLWPGLLLLLVAFSFLYITVPLAFWGQTPGMALCHVRARDAEDRPLTFGQTALRWLGSIVTAGLLGLPLVLALSGRSLADRISGSWSIGRPSDRASGAL